MRKTASYERRNPSNGLACRRAEEPRKRLHIRTFDGVYFAYVGRRTPCTDWPQFFGGRCPRRNHVIQIWWWSVKGFRVGWGSNFTLSHWLWWSPLQHSHTTVWACDRLVEIIKAHVSLHVSATQYKHTKIPMWPWPLVWPWNAIRFEKLSRYMLMQNFIKLSAAVLESTSVFCFISKLWKIRKSNPLALTFDLWPWHCLAFYWLFVQNVIKLRAAVHELSCGQRKNWRKHYCLSLPRTVKIDIALTEVFALRVPS